MKKKGMTQERGMVESDNPQDIQPISARAYIIREKNKNDNTNKPTRNTDKQYRNY